MDISKIKEIHPCIDDECVFKSCEYKWIVVLNMLPDTLTNENRRGIINKHYAKFRANKLKVILIFNKLNPTEMVLKIRSSNYPMKTIEYIVGEVIFVEDYDKDINRICASGIHYFRDIECAFYVDFEHFMPEEYSGKQIYYYASGRI